MAPPEPRAFGRQPFGFAANDRAASGRRCWLVGWLGTTQPLVATAECTGPLDMVAIDVSTGSVVPLVSGGLRRRSADDVSAAVDGDRQCIDDLARQIGQCVVLPEQDAFVARGRAPGQL